MSFAGLTTGESALAEIWMGMDDNASWFADVVPGGASTPPAPISRPTLSMLPPIVPATTPYPVGEDKAQSHHGDHRDDIVSNGSVGIMEALSTHTQLSFDKVLQRGRPQWATLRQVLTARTKKMPVLVEGIAESHPREAREEAARKLIVNHAAVLNDVTNPEPLTQTHLKRVPREHACFVDQALREACRRLIGRRTGVSEAFLLNNLLEERLDHTNPAQAKAWSMTAEYLERRIRALLLDTPHAPPCCVEAPSSQVLGT